MKFAQKFIIAIMLVMHQDADASDTAFISTSAQCNSCKLRLESRLSKKKGIAAVDLNLDNKKLMVIYDTSLISLENVEVKVTEIGYDANQKPAKKAAYKRLPACCRKDYQGAHH